MKGLGRRGFAIVVLAPLCFISVGSRTSATPGDPSARLQSCVEKSSHSQENDADLSVLFLVDTSSSLKQLDGGPGTDPTGKRADVLSVVTDLLSQTKSSKESETVNGTKVEVSFLDFGEAVGFSQLRDQHNREVTRKGGWTPVAEFVGKGGSEAISRYYPGMTHAYNTDYVRALSPGKNSNGERGAIDVLSRAHSQCRMMIWLTDGQPDFEDDRTNVPWVSGRPKVAELKRMTKNYLCANDPRAGKPLIADLVDQAEGSGGSFFLGALGLGPESQFQLLQAIVDGSCGNIGHPIGELTSVRRPEMLLDALVKILFPQQQAQTPQCSADTTISPSFHLNEAVSEARFVITSSLTDSIFIQKVSDPTKRIALLSSGDPVSSQLDSLVTVHARRLFQNGALDAVKSAGGQSKVYLFAAADFQLGKSGEPWWVGDWALNTGSACDSTNSSRVFLVGDLDLVPTSGRLRRSRDTTSTLHLRLAPRGGTSTEIEAGSFAVAEARVKIDGREIPESDIKMQDDRLDVTTTIDSKQSSVRVSVTATPLIRLTNPTEDGISEIPLPQLTVSDKRFDIVDAPAPPTISFEEGPRISKNHLSSTGVLNIHNTDKFLTSRICFTRPKEGGQSRWSGFLDIDASKYPSVTLPGLKADGQSSTNLAQCVRVSPDTKYETSVEFRSSKEAVGLQGQTLNVAQTKLFGNSVFESANSDEQMSTEFTVDVAVEVVSSKSPGLNLARMTLYGLAAILIPLSLMWLYNFFVGGKIRVPDGLTIYRRKYVITDDNIRDAESGSDFLRFEPSLVRPIPIASGRTRSYVDDSGLEFSGKFYFWRFFEEPHLIASDNAATVVINEILQSRLTNRTRGSLSLANSWIATVNIAAEQTSQNLSGTLLYFHIGRFDSDVQATRALQGFAGRLVETRNRLRELDSDAKDRADDVMVEMTPESRLETGQEPEPSRPKIGADDAFAVSSNTDEPKRRVLMAGFRKTRTIESEEPDAPKSRL